MFGFYSYPRISGLHRYGQIRPWAVKKVDLISPTVLFQISVNIEIEIQRRTAAIFVDLPIIENTFYSLTEGHRELEPTGAVTILEEPQPSRLA